MAITPNRDALKYLASFAIDAQFCQQYAAQAFHYSGDATISYQHLCENLSPLIEQMMADLALIKEHIPAFDVDESGLDPA